MLLDMDVELPDGSFLPLKILVDTGAQVNLVKRGLVSRQDWEIAQNPVRLITANNSVLTEGGKARSCLIAPIGVGGLGNGMAPLPFVGTLLQMQLASQINPPCLMKNPIRQILSENGMNIGKA